MNASAHQRGPIPITESVYNVSILTELAEPPQSHFQSSIQETLQSLQGTADRVTRQVEEFAKSLDRFNTARDHSDQTLWIDAWRLLERYSDIALNRRNQTSASSPSSLQDKRGRGDLEAQAENVQLEADLWILTKNLLVCHSPQTKFDAESNQDTRLGDLHRYTANTELWNAFLDSDIVGQEYECILDWLQERAAQSPTSIEEKLSDLAAKSERGDGVWSAGPMYTKSAIKKQKRARAWPLPLDPSNPALRHFHVRSSDQTPLVSQLDPDAQTREGSGLQDQDEYHEQAAWLTSWEMLRRGHHIGDIRSWWAERKEWWRAATICGCDPAAGQPQQSPWLRIMNLASNIQWLERCKLLCRGDVIGDEYQKAVYGLLCGDTAAPRTVCKSIDDHLFAIFNALLIERYQHYLHAYRHKLVDPSAIAYRPPPSSIGQVRQYVAYAQNDKSTKEESHQPHKFIEMALISGNFDAFFVQMGQAAAQVAHMTNQGAHLMEKDTTNPREPCAQLAAQNQDSVRIIAHLQVILRSLGFLEQAYRDHRYEMENNIANYIGSLQRDGKFILIPLYAAKLSEDRIPNVLGPILIEVTDPKERDSQVRLMKQYHINVSDVLYAIFYLANYNDIQRLRQAKLLFTAPRITEVGGTGKMQQIKVRSEFMSGELSDQEEIAVRSVEWYRYVDAENWGKACFSVSLLYKLFLAEGRLAAARDLYRSASLTDISLAAFSMNLRFADPATASDDFSDVGMDDDGAAAAAEEEEERVHPISPNPKRRERKKEHLLARPGTSRELLALKALVWAQLEELVIALEALEIWQDWVDDIDR